MEIFQSCFNLFSKFSLYKKFCYGSRPLWWALAGFGGLWRTIAGCSGLWQASRGFAFYSGPLEACQSPLKPVKPAKSRKSPLQPTKACQSPLQPTEGGGSCIQTFCRVKVGRGWDPATIFTVLFLDFPFEKNSKTCFGGLLGVKKRFLRIHFFESVLLS